MEEMIKRQAVTAACMERFGFMEVVPGKRDCGNLAAHAMHLMGHSSKLLNNCKRKTFRDALVYLAKNKFGSLVELMDATGLKRIAPASRWPGDIIAMPSEEGDGFGCSLAVALDNGRVLALNPASGLIEPMEPFMFVTAWRV